MAKPSGLLKISTLLGMVVLSFCFALFVFIFTEVGLRLSLKMAQYLAPAWGIQLNIENSSGFFARKFNIERVLIANENQRVELKDVHLEWKLDQLYQLPPKFIVEDFSIGQVEMAKKAIQENSQQKENSENNQTNINLEKILPENARLPLFFQVKNFFIGKIFYQKELLFKNLHISLKTAQEKKDKHHIENFNFDYKDLKIKLNANLGTEKPFALDAQLNVAGNLQQDFPQSSPFSIDATLIGNVNEMHFNLKSFGGLESFIQADFQPLKTEMLKDMKISVNHFNPKNWGGFLADLSLNLNMKQMNSSFLGDIKITNHEQNLPLEKVITDFSFKNEKLNLDNLLFLFKEKAGEIKGKAHIDLNKNFGLNFKISAVNLQKFSKDIPQTDINGDIQTSGHFDHFKMNIDVKNALSNFPLVLKGKMTFKDENIHLSPILLVYKQGGLSGDVDYSLKNKKMQMQLAFNHLDIQEFLKDSFLNGTLKAKGQLSPLLFSTDFNFEKSKLLGEDLNGKGVFNLSNYAVEKADINLDWGKNEIHALGSMGKKGKHLLDLKINAPQIHFLNYSGKGSVNAQLVGNLNVPTLLLNAHVEELKNKKGFLLQNLKANFHVSNILQDNLKSNITLDLLNIENQPQLLREFVFEISGKNNQHQINLKTRLPKREYLNFKINGSFKNDLTNFKKSKIFWEGHIENLKYYHRTRGGYSVLSGNKIALGEKNWEIKNLKIETENGSKFDFKLPFRSTLNAEGNAQKTNIVAELKSLNEKNQLHFETQWQNEEAIFKINDQRPWMIDFSANLDEMEWLSAALGENLELSGQTQANFKITGTPKQPNINGNLNGKNLKVLHNDFLLHLKDGIIDLNIENNLLNLNQFFWKNVLQKPPALLLNQDHADDLLKLVEKDGEISASGRLKLLDESNNNAQLSVVFQRVGLLQHADQWLVFSGNAQMLWENESVELDGDVKLDAGFWRIKDFGTPSISNDVVVRKTAEDAGTSVKIPWQPRAHLKVDMGEHFMFTGFGLSTLLTGNLDIFATGNDLPRAVGHINTKGGRFQAYGQRLFIRQGRLNFDHLATNPSLDIEALRFGARVAAGVKISGTAERPEITLISEPNVPDAEKLAWLILGHGPEDMSLGDAALLVSAADGLLGGNSGSLLNQLGSSIGIDSFNISQGNLNGNKRRITSRVVGSMQDSSSAGNDQILTIGKRLSERFRLSYEQSLGQADSLLRLFTRLKYGIFFIVSTGSDNTLDFYYRYSFGKPPVLKKSTQNPVILSPKKNEP